MTTQLAERTARPAPEPIPVPSGPRDLGLESVRIAAAQLDADERADLRAYAVALAAGTFDPARRPASAERHWHALSVLAGAAWTAAHCGPAGDDHLNQGA